MKKFAWLYILLGLSVLTAHAVELTNTNPRPTSQTFEARGGNATGYLNEIRVSDTDATDGVTYIDEKLGSNPNTVPFAETFSEAFNRTFESTFNANNANTAAISSNNNVPSGAPSGTTDFLVMTQPTALQAGDWFRAERGNNYIITKIQFIDVTNAGDSRFWFNPSTDIADTLKFDSLGTGAGTIRFAKQAMARDASNADSDAYSNLAGYDEPVILTGYTRVSANVLTGSGEWFFSGNAGTSLVIWPKANEKMALIARLKSGHFIKFGSYLLVLSNNPSLYNNQYTVTATRVSGTIPALNSSSILTALGDNIHRNEVSAAALKATLPAAGKYLRVRSDGADIEGADVAAINYNNLTNKPTDAQIGDKAFSNPPSDLTDTEKTAVKTAIGISGGAPTLIATDTNLSTSWENVATGIGSTDRLVIWGCREISDYKEYDSIMIEVGDLGTSTSTPSRFAVGGNANRTFDLYLNGTTIRGKKNDSESGATFIVKIYRY